MGNRAWRPGSLRCLLSNSHLVWAPLRGRHWGGLEGVGRGWSKGRQQAEHAFPSRSDPTPTSALLRYPAPAVLADIPLKGREAQAHAAGSGCRLEGVASAASTACLG